MKFLKKDLKLVIFGTIFILAVAIFLRLFNLTSIPVFVDEAIYVRWAQIMKAEPTLRFLPQSDGKQPLFMWIVIPALKFISDPLVAGRMVSVASGIGTLVGLLLLSYVLFRNLTVSFFGALIYAVSPFSVFFDRLALADSLLTFFGVWTLLFSVLAVKNKRLDLSMITGFFLGGALLTKSPGVYFSLLIPFTLLLGTYDVKKKFGFVKSLAKTASLFIPTYIIAYGMYNVLRLGPNYHMIAIRNKDYVYPLSHILSSPLDPLKPFLSRSLEYLWILGPSLLVIMLICGICLGIKKYTKETLLVVMWGFLPVIASSEFSRTMTARYIYFSTPYFFVLSSLILLQSFGKKKFSIYLRYASYIIVAVFLIHSLFIDKGLLTKPQSVNLPRSERSGYLEDWTSGYGIKEVSSYIRELSGKLPPEKHIVVGTEGFFGTLPDGLQIYTTDLVNTTVIGIGLNIDKLPDSLVESKKAGNRTFLVVNRSRLFNSPEKLGITLIGKYEKAIKPDGTRDELLLFEVN